MVRFGEFPPCFAIGKVGAIFDSSYVAFPGGSYGPSIDPAAPARDYDIAWLQGVDKGCYAGFIFSGSGAYDSIFHVLIIAYHGVLVK